MFSYSKTVMELALKVQEVILAGDGEKDQVGGRQQKKCGATGCGRLTKTGHFSCYEKLQARPH